jgi:O-antigen/teichoic acid export membrane protein
VNTLLAQQTGSAVFWKTLQLAGGKLIFLLRLVLLARLLTPDDFGLVAIATSATGFLLAVTDFGMIPALVQRKDVTSVHFDAAWSAEVGRTAIVVFTVVVAAPVITQLYNEPAATNVLRALALRPLIVSLSSVKVADLTRELQFRPLAILYLIEVVVNAALSVALATVYGVWGLVIGTLAGSLARLGGSYVIAPHRPRLVFISSAIQPLLSFGRWILLTSLVVTLAGTTLSVVISRRLGAAELGLYYLASQIAFLPYEASHEIIGAVAFPLYARLQNKVEQAAQTFRAVFSSMMALLFPVAALIIVLAPTIVAEMLGPKWQGTGPIIQVLTVVTMVGILTEASIPIFKGLGQPQRETVIEFIQAVILVGSVWFLAGRFGVVGAAAAWIPALLVAQFLAALFLSRVLEKPFSGLGVPIVAVLLITGAGSLVAYVINGIISGLLGLFVAASMAVFVMALLIWSSDRQLHTGLVSNLSLIFPQVSRWLLPARQSS